MELNYTHPGFDRISLQITEEQREKLLTSALSKFIILNKSSLFVLVLDSCYIHSKRALQEHFPTISYNNAALHGFLGDAAIFSLVITLEHKGFEFFSSLAYADIDRVSQCVYAAFATQKFIKEYKFCSQCGQKTKPFKTLKTSLFCDDCEKEIQLQLPTDVLSILICDNNISSMQRSLVMPGETIQQAVTRQYQLQRTEIQQIITLPDNIPFYEQYLSQAFFVVIKSTKSIENMTSLETWELSQQEKTVQKLFQRYVWENIINQTDIE
ncbi:NADH pyrophosphatase [Spironucleus salmonicida]|uniref:NADH pyrophosphatase n=1 Tax=Spironucleus salmonicida TaxID=348837 RepID=V6LK94_9EUKA|nr:NADH pyrophosphatase [Spironucleus salmonicida]|eukprot:EST44972.1 NADH pyrophosphatase [Spironucleus salmonicida]